MSSIDSTASRGPAQGRLVRSLENAKSEYERRSKELEERSEKNSQDRVESNRKKVEAEIAAYNEKKQRLTQDTEKKITNITNETNDSKLKMQHEYAKSLQDLRSQQFKRQKDLKEDRDSTVAGQQKRYDHQLDTLRDKYNNSLQSTNQNYKQQFEQYNDKTSGQVKDILGNAANENVEKDKLFQKKFSEQEKIFQNQKHQLLDKSRDEIEAQFKLADNNRKLNEQLHRQETKDVQYKEKARRELMTQEFAKKQENQMNKFQSDYLAQEKDHKSDLNKIRQQNTLEKKLNDYIQNRDREIAKAGNGLTLSTGDREKDRMLQEVHSLKNQKKSLLDQLSEQGQQYEKNLKVNQEEARQSKSAVLIDHELKTFKSMQQKELEQQNKNQQKEQLWQFKYDQKLKELAHGEKIDQKKVKEHLKVMEDHYVTNLKEIQSQQELRLEAMKMSVGLERKNENRLRENEEFRKINEVHQYYQSKIMTLEQSYESQLGRLKVENEAQLNQLKKDFVGHAAKQDETIKQIKESFSREMHEKGRLSVLSMEDQKNRYEERIELLHQGYTKKMHQNEVAFRSEHDKMQKDFQLEISELKRKSSEISQRKTDEKNFELQRQGASFQAERTRLITQYENIIERLKVAYEDKMTDYQQKIDQVRNQYGGTVNTKVS